MKKIASLLSIFVWAFLTQVALAQVATEQNESVSVDHRKTSAIADCAAFVKWDPRKENHESYFTRKYLENGCDDLPGLSSADEERTETRYSGPIIDMHLHAYNSDDYWGSRKHRTGIPSPKTAEKHLEHTQALMAEHNITKAVIDGRSVDIISRLSEMDHFLVGYQDGKKLMEMKTFEELVEDGTIQVFGEVSAVYKGTTLNDPIYEPYLKICEEYGIPVAYHTAGAPSMAPYNCCPDFRLSNGDPLLIEDVLVKYPNLKIYMMHSGEMFYEGQEAHSHFSPDGKWIVYATEEYGINDEEPLVQSYIFNPQMYGEIVAMRLSDGKKFRLTHNKWEEGAPLWVRER